MTHSLYVIVMMIFKFFISSAHWPLFQVALKIKGVNFATFEFAQGKGGKEVIE